MHFVSGIRAAVRYVGEKQCKEFVINSSCIAASDSFMNVGDEKLNCYKIWIYL